LVVPEPGASTLIGVSSAFRFGAAGPIARALGGADIAKVIGLPVAALVYVFVYRSFDLQGEQLLAEAADLGLEPTDTLAD
jgi:hypothetical protein